RRPARSAGRNAPESGVVFSRGFRIPWKSRVSSFFRISMLTSKEKSDTRRLPMMPIRDVVIFPHMMTPFVVGRDSSVRALEEALASDKKIFLATQHDASI